MRFSSSSCCLLLLYLLCQCAFASHSFSKRDLSSFIDSEKAIALDGILANIGPDGTLAQGAKAGVVIASPSTVNPNYLYTWTRDSALTLKTLIDEFTNGNEALQSHIEDYVSAVAYLQTVTNPSGSLSTGAGLGEPKYNIDLTRFNGAWGRFVSCAQSSALISIDRPPGPNGTAQHSGALPSWHTQSGWLPTSKRIEQRRSCGP